MTATYATSTQLKNFMGFSSTDTTFSATQLQDALDRAEAWINEETHTIFVDGTGATPAYIQVTDEKHTGKEAQALYFAVANRKQGVLRWIKRHW